MLFIMFVKIFHGLYSIGNSRLAGVTKVREFLLHKILKWLKRYILGMNGKEVYLFINRNMHIVNHSKAMGNAITAAINASPK